MKKKEMEFFVKTRICMCMRVHILAHVCIFICYLALAGESVDRNSDGIL